MNRLVGLFPKKLPEWTVPILYLVVGLAAFGSLIPRQGFYWDDWAQLFEYHAFGASGFWAYFASDRPASAWTHVLFSPVFGSSSVEWHLFSLVLRWLAGVGAWGLFCELWPAKRWQAAAAGLIFFVYPEFSQQAISVAYHQHWMQYVLFLASLLAMLRAQRSSRYFWLWTLLGLAAQLLQFSITEYFVGSELLRPVFLWVLFGRTAGASLRQRAGRTLLAWLPYALVWGGFVFWRLFVFSDAGVGPNSPALLLAFRSQPFSAMAQLVKIVFWDVFYILISSWGRVFAVTRTETSQPFVLAAWAVGLLVGAACAGFFYRLIKNEPIPGSGEARGEGLPNPGGSREMLLVSILAVLLGPVPLWALGGTILNDPDPYHADRYALAALFGVGLFFSVVLDWIGRARLQKSILFGVFIGLAVCYQLRSADEYSHLWQVQTRFLWQLSWRVPAIKPGTGFISEEVIFPFQGNFSTASAINMIYPQTGLPDRVETWLYALLPRYAGLDKSPGRIGLHTTVRTSTFDGSSEAGIFLETGNPRQTCLWVLTPADRKNPYLTDYYRSWLSDAYRGQISGGPPPEDKTMELFLGKRPAPDWCEYFEKAELAVQMGNWTEGARLGDEALKMGFKPQISPSNSAREWMAMIEAFARSGQWGKAAGLTLDADKGDANYRPMFCELWGQLVDSNPTTSADELAAVHIVEGQLGCGLE